MTDNRGITELKNLGPACERDLHAVGIYTAEDIRKHGVEGTFVKLMEGRIARGTGGFCFNASYLYALYGALHDVDWREIPNELQNEYKELSARLRKQYAPQKSKK